MLFIFRATLFAFVALSFLLVIGVPVAFASPDGWKSSKSFIFSGVSAWVVLVFVVGILNSFVT